MFRIIISAILKNAKITIDKDLAIYDNSFFTDVLLKGSIGLGDSYIEGKWDSDGIDEIIFKILSGGIYQKIARLYNLTREIKGKFVNLQDATGSKKVIDKHYDLPVDFYAGFLDPYFQYTCGFFENVDDLNTAQEKKMDLICQKMELQLGSRVLDIGGGWGGLARFMQESYGVIPTVVTLSKEQANYIRDTTQGIDVLISDYRDIPKLLKGQFDAVSAVGVFEHIGHKNYHAFMKVVYRILKNKGRFLLHTLFTPYPKPATNPWLNKHIFPNGELPPIRLIKDEAKKYFSEYANNFPHFQELTPHYYPTLMAWDENLKESIAEGKIFISEKEKRKWHFYFMSCAGAIRAKHMRIGHFLYVK